MRLVFEVDLGEKALESLKTDVSDKGTFKAMVSESLGEMLGNEEIKHARVEVDAPELGETFTLELSASEGGAA